MNAIDSLTARMGQYVDNYLQPVVQKTESYLKDTQHILQLIENIDLKGEPIILATADVSLLYTIIRHHQTCEAVKCALRKHTSLPCMQRKYIIKCIDFCLKNNYFLYQQTFFHQKTGVAKGAKFAPTLQTYSQWEEESVYKYKPIELILYKRYIDDIIIIWKGTKEKPIIFLDGLNRNYRNIELTWDINEITISYLDLDIMQANNRLTTETHFKNVDRKSYLTMESCHHKNWLYNIPKGQMLRLRRNCTNTNDYKSRTAIYQ